MKTGDQKSAALDSVIQRLTDWLIFFFGFLGEGGPDIPTAATRREWLHMLSTMYYAVACISVLT